MREFAAQLVRVGPNAGAHRVAIRCAISVGVPMLALLASGRLDLLGVAAFGAFTAVYGRDLRGAARARLQALTGAALTLSVIIGLIAAHLPMRPWSSTLIMVVVAAAGTIAGNIVQWRPAGPLFFIFACGAFAAGSPLGWAASMQIAGVTALTAAFAVAVGAMGTAPPARRDVASGRAVTGTWRDATGSGTLVDVVAASAVAGALAIGLGLEHVYWAVLSAAVPASVSLRGPWLAKATHRIIGTAAGLLVAAPLLAARLPGWGIVAAALVLQWATESFVPRNYGVAMLFITPLALLISSAAQPGDVGALLSDRLSATVVGILAGVVVLLVRALILRVRRPTALLS